MKFFLIVGLIGAIIWLSRRASAGKEGLDAQPESDSDEERHK